jgi:hypothetical protein
MSLEAAQHLLDEFNDGNWDEVGSYFNDEFDLFLDYLSKYELDHKIAFHEVDEEFKNTILLKNLEINKENTLRFICDDLVTDVSIMDGGYYMYLRSRDELAELFDKGYRDDSSYYAAKAVLLGEDYWEPYYDTTDDVYGDVIEELDPENMKRLYEYIVNELEGIEISPETELLNDIANVQNGESAMINQKNVESVVKDSETMGYLLDHELSELYSELHSIHDNAYNQSYESEVYREVWGALNDIFDIDKREYVYQQHPYKKETQIEVLKMPIRNFYQPIIDYLDNFKGTTQTLEYHGDFIGILEENDDCVSMRVPDYADHSETVKNINEIFGDYI